MKKYLFGFAGQQAKEIIIVSGLPRSGTSMMMKILEAGGLPIMTDSIRSADEDNPKGYYEFERVKQLPKGDKEWLNDAKGKVVKVISALLQHLPTDYDYKVVFMQRNIEEVLASQRKMLVRRGQAADNTNDDKMSALFQKHLQKIENWLNEQANFSVLYVNYNEVLAEPLQQIEQLNYFFDDSLNQKKMLAVVEPTLYRNRS